MNTTTAKRLDGIHEYYFSGKMKEIEQLNRQGLSIINLGIGSPDQPPHPEVIKTLQEQSAGPHNHAYQGYKGIPALRQAFADWYASFYNVKLNPDSEILPLIGSKEGIMHICMTYLGEGDKALVPDPGYPTYNSAVRLAGALPLPYSLDEERDWLPDYEALSGMDLSSVKLMFVNYPHMPSGRRADRKVFEELVAFATRNHILLIHDNPYSFILNERPFSILEVEGAKAVALELNSLSKSHNMAGWRIGVLSGAASRIEAILRFKSNMDSGMFLPLQLAAVKALELGKDWYAEVNEIYRLRKKQVYILLDLLGCRYTDCQSGMFVWAKIPEAYPDGYAFSDEVLRTARVFITPGGIFGQQGNRYIRVSLCRDLPGIEEATDRIKHSGLMVLDNF